MSIKTTLHLKFSQSILLYELAARFDVSVSSIINLLAYKMFKPDSFTVRFLQSVSYQERLTDGSDRWKRLPVSFKEDVYEKCLDMRKVFKLSVSRLFAEAIAKYFDEIILELEGKKNSDNYTSNYIQLFTKNGYYCQITLLWEIIEAEKLKKIQEGHCRA